MQRVRPFYLIVIVVVVLLGSCNKVIDQSRTSSEGGYNEVRMITGGTTSTIRYTPVRYENKPAIIAIAEISRGMVALDRIMTVLIKDDHSLVNATNPSWQVLPDSLYSVNDGCSKIGSYFRVTFQPGEFTKQVYITINNPTLLNPRFHYAIGLTLESSDANGIISSERSMITRIQTANRWDGVYNNIGNPAAPDLGFRDVTVPSALWGGNQEYSLVTIGPDKCVVINNDPFGINTANYYFYNVSSLSAYGGYGLVVTFDSITNHISSIHNAWGDTSQALYWIWPPNGFPTYNCMSGPPLYSSCNTRRAVLDPTGDNKVLPNKDIIIKHFMLQPSAVPTPPSIRSYFDETWKYIRPR